MKAYKLLTVLLVALLAAAGVLPVVISTQAAEVGQEINALTQLPTNQLIIKYKDIASVDFSGPDQANEMVRLSDAAGIDLAYFRPMSGDAHVLRLPSAMPDSEVAAIAAKLAALPDVEYAEPDSIMLPLETPNDPQYANQWHYLAPGGNHYGVNAPAAWDITQGSPNVVVAVLDTGITDHPDLYGRWTGGYDFVTDPFMGNDGTARDADPHDPGDWILANECGGTHSAQNSSWHGTHVAGTIGAASNNGLGVAGVNWNSLIVPVRVLGKCGGTSSDIADAMRWAAGLSVTGVPANPLPAKVINMSLGGYGPCPATYQDAVNAVVAAGTSLIISAGNSTDDSALYRPGNCNGVITIAATNRDGSIAYYSNYGATVEISGPGGAQSSANDPNGILSTLNSGATVPGTANYEYYQGTSMAAPHVAGVASLVYSLSPSLTPTQLTNILRGTVTLFPGGSSCNTSICGSGIVNAYNAVNAIPGLKTISPARIPTQGVATTISVVGTHFTASSIIKFNNTSLTTHLVSSTQMTATIPAASINHKGFFNVTVTDPSTAYGSVTTEARQLAVDVELTYLPLARRGRMVTASQPPAPTPTPTTVPSGWINIMTDGFESGFPGSIWQLSDQYPGTGEFYWAQRNCKASTGSFSVWAIGGGAQGSGLGCGATYPSDADSWMIYGPFNLTGATAAELNFDAWYNTEVDYDFLCRLASPDGSSTTYDGWCSHGSSGGWTPKTLDLVDYLGDSSVWIALYFMSDISGEYAEGAYVDNVVLRKCTGSCSAAAAPITTDLYPEKPWSAVR